MNKRLKCIILFSTAVLALGTIGSTTASVNASFIPANQYVVWHRSKIEKEMPKNVHRFFDYLYVAKPARAGRYSTGYRYDIATGYLLLHPKASLSTDYKHIHYYASGNPLRNGYRNYLNGTFKIYAKPENNQHDRVVANNKTVKRLANNFTPCRVLRKAPDGYNFQVHFKSGLTGWIDEKGIYQSNSYSKVKRCISALNAYEISPHDERKSLKFYARFNNKEGRRARAILRKYRHIKNEINGRIVKLINNSAYNVYRNHRHMNKTAKRDLAKATKLINHYKHFHNVLKYDDLTIYKSLIKTAKKGRVATNYDDDPDSNSDLYFSSNCVTGSKKATLYNIRHFHLILKSNED